MPSQLFGATLTIKQILFQNFWYDGTVIPIVRHHSYCFETTTAKQRRCSQISDPTESRFCLQIELGVCRHRYCFATSTVKLGLSWKMFDHLWGFTDTVLQAPLQNGILLPNIRSDLTKIPFTRRTAIVFHDWLRRTTSLLPPFPGRCGITRSSIGCN